MACAGNTSMHTMHEYLVLYTLSMQDHLMHAEHMVLASYCDDLFHIESVILKFNNIH